MPRDDGAALHRALADAEGTGEIIAIVYDGGSDPGSRRDIVVRRLGRDRVHAHCLASGGGYRTFLVDNMRLAQGDEPVFVAAPRSVQRRRSRADEQAPDDVATPPQTRAPPPKMGRLAWLIGLIGLMFWLTVGARVVRWMSGH